jgi:hypothetical protein
LVIDYTSFLPFCCPWGVFDKKGGTIPPITTIVRSSSRLSDMFEGPVPAGVQVVPRTDGSMFFVNTTSKPATIKLTKATVDRISGERMDNEVRMKAHGVLWLK